ncbi:RNA polymerase sigma factor [Siminovitchia fortis]|uniref:RNA polymerase sigma factor n=1 Tax=Siminovitchia fortis TaxID=254758 RepID=UPI0026D7EA27
MLQLVMAEKDAYYRLALTYMKNEHDAMDVMEDMILTLYQKIDQLKKAEAFYSWSKTILVNMCKSTFIKQQKIIPLESASDAQHSYLAPFLSSEQRLDIQNMLIHLNDHQREAIELKYFHDLDYKTIAKITGVSIGTAKSRIFVGLKKLREIFGGDSNE